MENYYAIEVEVTNFCNAKCVFCANDKLAREKGFLNLKDFEKFILFQEKIRTNNFFYNINKNYPRITFCGLGEPLLHPEIAKLVKCAAEHDFYTQLVTNGELLNKKKLEELCEAGLREIAISLHSLNEVNYNQITGIRLATVKDNLMECKEVFKKNKIKVSIWRIYHPDKRFRDTNDEKIYCDFLKQCGIENAQILGPSEPWSRDGIVKDTACDIVGDYPFWCNKIPFTFNIDLKGNVVICCNDYNRETVDLGNVFDEDFDFDLMKKKKDIYIKKKVIPEICIECKRWSDNEITSILSENEISELCKELLK